MAEQPQQRRSQVNATRILVIEQAIKDGYAHGTIEASYAETWGVSRRTIRNYVKRVYDEWRKRAAEDPRDDREMVRLQFLDLRQRAIARGDLRVALLATDRLARLGGLYVDRIEVAGAGGGPLRVTVEEARAELRTRLARLADGGGKDKAA